MANIIAGRFDELAQVERATEELVRAGFAPDRICNFYVSSTVRPDDTPVGGDDSVSPRAEDSSKGVATGTAVGATVGIAGAPVLGPVGPLLGAHLGSLIGSLSKMDDADESPPIRHSGLVVAVEVMGDENEARAVDTLRALGAVDIERGSGTIADGDWPDFDPASAPQLVDRPAHGMKSI